VRPGNLLWIPPILGASLMGASVPWALRKANAAK